MKHALPYFLGSALVLLASCNKDLPESPDSSDITIDNIQARDFDFSGTHEVELNISLPTHLAEFGNSTLTVYNGHPDEGGSLIGKFGSNGTKINQDITLPKIVDTVFFHNSLTGWSKAAVINHGVQYAYEANTGFGDDELASQKAGILKKAESATGIAVMSKSSGISAGSIANGNFSGPSNFSTVSDYKSSMNYGEWYKAYGPSSDCEVYNFGGSYGNVFKFEDTDKEDGLLQKITATGGEQIELQFDVYGSKKSKVYAYIISMSGGKAKNYAYEKIELGKYGYSENTWYTETVNLTTYSSTDYVVIEFYCKTYDKYGDYLYIDNVSVNGNNDSDNDGVDDDDDDFPNDPNLAYLNYYPNAQDFGSVVYEDLWPAQGDYDFNDLSMAYQYAFYNNADNETVEMEGTYHIRATGAGYNNGFGVALPVSPSDVSSVSGYDHAGGLIDLAGNGLESGHSSEAVFIVYDRIADFLGGTMFNVEPSGKTIQADTTRVMIEFNDPQALTPSAFDPFIFVDGDRSREVHLKNYDPTALADANFFGSVDDASNPGSGVYYQNANGLPWAIDIPVEFEHMIEKNEILDGYLYFGAWAQSNGTNYPDWYSNQAAGYRNNSLIY
jgi:LruC domain-containing protein